MQDIGKMLLFTGGLLCIAGIAILGLSKLFHGNVHLPGDILYRKGNFTFYFPVATSLLISIVISLVLNLFLRRR